MPGENIKDSSQAIHFHVNYTMSCVDVIKKQIIGKKKEEIKRGRKKEIEEDVACKRASWVVSQASSKEEADLEMKLCLKDMKHGRLLPASLKHTGAC